MNAQREKAEKLIYDVMDKLDPKQYNSAYYKAIFAKMSDSQFRQFCSRNLPFRFHTKPFVIEPKMYDIEDALKVMNVPLLEKVALPYLYIDRNGNPLPVGKGEDGKPLPLTRENQREVKLIAHQKEITKNLAQDIIIDEEVNKLFSHR